MQHVDWGGYRKASDPGRHGRKEAIDESSWFVLVIPQEGEVEAPQLFVRSAGTAALQCPSYNAPRLTAGPGAAPAIGPERQALSIANDLAAAGRSVHTTPVLLSQAKDAGAASVIRFPASMWPAGAGCGPFHLCASVSRKQPNRSVALDSQRPTPPSASESSRLLMMRESSAQPRQDDGARTARAYHCCTLPLYSSVCLRPETPNHQRRP